MRLLLSIAAIAFGVGCAHTHAPFVQGGIRIVSPVRQEEGPNHTHIIDAFNDGGTKLIRITDAEGKKFDVYFDHRIGTSTPGAVYLVDKPGRSNSVLVVNQREFRQKIEVSE
jgi:hypothetical protein